MISRKNILSRRNSKGPHLKVGSRDRKKSSVAEVR